MHQAGAVGRTLVAIALVAVVSIVGPRVGPAGACSCMALGSQSLGNRAADADVAVVAHVRDGQAIDIDGRGGAVDRLVEVEVDEVLRGTIDRSVPIRATGCSVNVPAGAVGLLLTRRDDQWRLDGCATEGVVEAGALRAAPWRAPAPSGTGAMTAIVVGRFGEAVVAGLDAEGHVVRWGVGARQAVGVSRCDGSSIALITTGTPGAVEVRALPSLDLTWRRELPADLPVAPIPFGNRRTSIACAGDGSAVVVADPVRAAGVVTAAGWTPLSGVSWVAGASGQVVASNQPRTGLSIVDPSSSTVTPRATVPSGFVGTRHAIGPDGTIAVLAGPAGGALDTTTATALVLVPPAGNDHEPVVVPIDVTEVQLLRWIDADHVEVSFGSRDAQRQVIARDGTVRPVETPAPGGGRGGIVLTAGPTQLIQTGDEVLRGANGEVVASPALVGDAIILDHPVPIPVGLPTGTTPAGSFLPGAESVEDGALGPRVDTSSGGSAAVVVAVVVAGLMAVVVAGAIGFFLTRRRRRHLP